MDSVQLYKRLDIGSAKPSSAELAAIAHHLVDFVEPDQHYDVSDFVRDADQAIATIISHDKLPVLVGGTGLYLRGLLNGLFHVPEVSMEVRQAVRQQLNDLGHQRFHDLLKKYDPATASRLHSNDSQRLCRAMEIYQATGTPWSTLLAQQQETSRAQRYRAIKIGLERPRQELYERINKRVDIMVAQGLLAEVEGLLRSYTGQEKALQTIGYRHMVHYIRGKYDWQECLRLLARDTRRYAKRQLTWFKADKEIQWFHPDQHQAILAAIQGGINGL